MNQKILCPQCQADNFESSAVCWQCGTPLKQAAQPAVESVPAEPEEPEQTITESEPAVPEQEEEKAVESDLIIGAIDEYPDPDFDILPEMQPKKKAAVAPKFVPGMHSVRPMRPMMLSAAVILIWIVSGIRALMSLSTVLHGSQYVHQMASSDYGSATMPTGVHGILFAIGGVFMILYYIAVGFVGFQLWLGHNWARTALMAISGLGVLASLIGMRSSFLLGLLGLAFNIACLVILFRRDTSDYCSI